MGLSSYTARWIERNIDLRGKHVITIGRQRMSNILFGSEWADGWLRGLGATVVHSIDLRSDEGATFIHDLTTPIPRTLENTYDFVFDGGTIEHMIDPLAGLCNYVRLLSHKCILVISTVANNYCGHGFYQFSPEFFRATLPGCVVELVEDGVKLPKLFGFHLPFPMEVRGREVFEPNFSRKPVAMLVSSPKTDVIISAVQKVYQPKQ